MWVIGQSLGECVVRCESSAWLWRCNHSPPPRPCLLHEIGSHVSQAAALNFQSFCFYPPSAGMAAYAVLGVDSRAASMLGKHSLYQVSPLNQGDDF